jgi:DNA-binding MarR family transcriptional regulator
VTTFRRVFKLTFFLVFMEERSFPEDPDERLDAILNVVNTEFKNLCLLHMDDRAKIGQDIRAGVRSTVGRGVYLPTKNSFDAYCLHTLFPIGVVAKDEIMHGGEIGYLLTPEGMKYGLPIAALALDWVNMNDTSLFEVLGPTATTGSVRAPFARINVLEKLASGKNKAKDIHTSSLLNNHITPLSDIGFITYVPGKSFGGKSTTFSLIDVPENYSGFKLSRISEKVVEYLKDNSLSRGVCELARSINEAQPSVSRALYSLERGGCVACDHGDVSFSARVVLEEKGRRFLEDFVYPVRDALEDGGSLSDAEETYRTIVGDPELFGEYSKRAIELYRAVSPRLNPGATLDSVLEYIRCNPGARPKEISGVMGTKVDNHLATLKKRGDVSCIRNGTSSKYFSAD